MVYFVLRSRNRNITMTRWESACTNAATYSASIATVLSLPNGFDTVSCILLYEY